MLRPRNRNLRSFFEHGVVRAVAVAALVTPAAAVAAEPIADDAGEGTAPAATRGAATPGEREQRAARERTVDPLELAARRERRRRRLAAGPFHPVLGPVDYGNAVNAFGNARGRPHEGQDIFAPAGTPVISPVAGVVVDAGDDGGRGNWAAIYDRERDRTYSYFHMIEPARVEVGEKVRPAERVGRVGCTGSCWGDHLHFEVREGRGPYGKAIDPMPMLQRWRSAGG